MRTSLTDLQSVLGVLSAMITPTVLILACTRRVAQRHR